MAGGRHEEGSLADDLARALETAEGADVALVVGGGARLPAHSFVLSARSPALAAALRRGAPSGSVRSLELADVDEETARALLCFLYTDQVPQLAELAPQLLAAGDRYRLPLLKRRCEQQLVRALTVETAATAVALALRHDCPLLCQRAIYFIRAHPLDVMATDSWQQDLCPYPDMVTEVSRLIASPSTTQIFSEISAPAGSATVAAWASSPALVGPAVDGAGAAPASPLARQSAPPGSDVLPQLWSMSGEELNVKLLEAAQRGSVEELRAMLEAGMDAGSEDEGRSTALHFAACNGHLDAVECLLEHGAAVNARDHNRDTALHWAAGRGHAAVVRQLAAAGADPNARGKYGMAPLHWAALCGHADAAARLLEAGADLGARDDCGSTPLDLIRRANHLDMVEMLT